VSPEEQQEIHSGAFAALVCLKYPAEWERAPAHPRFEEMLSPTARRALAASPDTLTRWHDTAARLRWDVRDARALLPVPPGATRAVVALLPRVDVSATWLPRETPDGGVTYEPPSWAVSTLLAEARGFVVMERSPGCPWLVSSIIAELSPGATANLLGLPRQGAN
jgi:hypothetical protein